MNGYLKKIFFIFIFFAILEANSRPFSFFYVHLFHHFDSKAEGKVLSVNRINITSSTLGPDLERYDVRYEYLVDNVYYVGWIVSFDGYPKKSEVMGKYYSGSPVDVFYDTKSPEFAILEKGDLALHIYIAVILFPFFIAFVSSRPLIKYLKTKKGAEY